MPAIQYQHNASETYPYQFAPGRSFDLSYENHVNRQVCNTWFWGSVAAQIFTFSSALLLFGKTTLHLASFYAIRLAPPRNIPGHHLPYIGSPLNYFWKNAFRVTFWSLLGSTLNIISHLQSCMGEHLYSFRSYTHSNQDEKAIKRADFMVIQFILETEILTTFNLTTPLLPYRFRFPDHTFIYLSPSFISTARKNVLEDPEFQELVDQSKNFFSNSFVISDSVSNLIYKHMKALTDNQTAEEL